MSFLRVPLFEIFALKKKTPVDQPHSLGGIPTYKQRHAIWDPQSATASFERARRHDGTRQLVDMVSPNRWFCDPKELGQVRTRTKKQWLNIYPKELGRHVSRGCQFVGLNKKSHGVGAV